MKRRIISALLLIVMLISLVPAQAFAAETTTADVTGTEMTVGGDSSFGSLLGNTVSEEQEKQSSGEEFECRITDLTVEDTQAVVEYSINTPATVVVAIYSDDGFTMLGSGKASAAPDSTWVAVDIEISNMPAYFTAGAFMLDPETNNPISEEFKTTRYTKAYMDIKAATVADFDPELVLNLDDNMTTNFAVFNENTILADEADAVSVVDNQDGTYIINTTDERILAMQPGDTFAYTYADGTVLIICAADVEKIDETSVCLTEQTDAELSDVFDFVKIEADSFDAEEVTYDDRGLPDGVEMVDPATIDQPDDASAAWLGDIPLADKKKSKSDSFGINLDCNLGDNIKLTGAVKCEFTASLEVFISWNYQSVTLSFENENSISINLTASVEDEIPFPAINIKFLPGVTGHIEPKFVFEVSASVDWYGKLTTTIKYVYDGDTGFTNASSGPALKSEANIDGKIYVGLNFDIGISVISKKILTGGMNAEVGIELTMHENINLVEPETEIVHECPLCFDGELNAVFSLNVYLDILDGWKKPEKQLADKNFKLSDCYYSVDYNEFAFTKCPHISYKISVQILKGETSVETSVPLEIYQNGQSVGSVYIIGENCKPVKSAVPATSDSGTSTFYLPNGKYKIAVELDGSRQEKEFTVKDGGKELKLVFEEKGSDYPLTISETELEMDKGSAQQLNVYFKEKDVTRSCTWQSSDSAIVSVDKGKATAKKAGSAVISASYSAAGKTYSVSCKITIASIEIASGKCGQNLTWMLDKNGVLTISGSGKMDNYSNTVDNFTTFTSRPWETYSEEIKTAVIESGVTSIGDYAFSSCSALTSVTIGNSVTKIGMHAFYQCSSLTSVSIPDSVTSIGAGAFWYCTALTSVTIPSKVTSIGYSAFDGCRSLTSVTIPGSVTSIGERAFYGCSCLTSVTIPDSVTSIGDAAFLNCTALTSVTIPDSVTSIGAGAFAGCAALTSINAASGNRYYSSVNGVLFNKAGTELVCYPAGRSGAYTIPGKVTSICSSAFDGCRSLTSISIPDSVTSIGYGAFLYCTALTSISIPDSVTIIGDAAFAECAALTSVTIPSKVTRIGDGTFACSGLISITIPDNVTSIGGGAFMKCPALTSVTIPDSVTIIGDAAFAECAALTSVTIPDSVTIIGDAAFAECAALTSINATSGNRYYSSVNGVLFNKAGTELVCYPAGRSGAYTIPGKVTSIGYSAFDDCRSLTSITIPDSVTSIGNAAFLCCTALTSVTIPSKVTRIGNSTFACSGLISITIPDSVTIIVNGAFSGCRSLADIFYNGTQAQWEAITIGEHNDSLTNAAIHYAGEQELASGTCGENLTWVFDDAGTLTISGTGAMYDYSSDNEAPWRTYNDKITKLVINSGVTSIGNYAFQGCYEIADVDLPDSIASIGNNAFDCCHGLTSFDIPDKVTSIGLSTFYNCSKLESVAIPNGITSIGDSAFCACENLSEIAIPENVTSIGANAFYGCSKLACITIPGKVATISNRAFYKCTGLINLTISYGVSTIGEEAFSGCSSLTSVTIPSGVTVIDDNAFSRCSNLVSVYIPDSVIRIDLSAFYSCGLTDVYYNGTQEEWNDITIGENNDSLTSATIHYNSEASTTSTEDDEELDEADSSVASVDGQTEEDVEETEPPVEEELEPLPEIEIEPEITEDENLSENSDEALGEDAFSDIPAATEQPELELAAAHNGTSGTSGKFKTAKFTNLEPGEEYVLIVSVNPAALLEPANLLYIAQDNAAADGTLTLSYIPRTDTPSAMVTLYGVPHDRYITLDREYITMKTPETGESPVSASVKATVTPAEWSDYLTWSVNPGDEGIISVGANGEITPLAVGTGYAVATVSYKDYTFSARCRVDVTEKSAEEALKETEKDLKISGVQLGASSVTSELYSRDYAEFDIVLLLPQNGSAMESGSVLFEKPEDNGVAIKSARFTDPTAESLFDLVVVDDRRVAVVPKDDTINNPKTVKSSYTSAVAVTVGNTEFVTDVKIKLTVKKTMPKLKANAVQFNSFYSDQTSPIVINGVTVTKIEKDTSKKNADWLTLDAESKTLKLNENAPQKSASGSVYLKVYTEEWAIPASVTVSVKNNYKAPTIKLKKSSVTLNPAYSDSVAVDMVITPTDYAINAKSVKIEVTPAKGASAGDIAAVPTEDGKLSVSVVNSKAFNKTYKVTASIPNTKSKAVLTVKTNKENTKPTVTLKTSGAIDLSYPGSAVVITPTVKNYSGEFTNYEGTVTVKTGKTTGEPKPIDEYFDIEKNGNVLTLTKKDGKELIIGSTYTAAITLKNDGAGASATASAKITVKQTAVSLKLSKSSVSLNKLYGDSVAINVTCSLKNYVLGDDMVIVNVADKTGKNLYSEGNEPINAEYFGGKLYVTVTDKTVYGAAYKVLIKAKGSTKTTALTVTIPTEAKSKASVTLKAKGSIDTIRDDTKIVFTPTYKNTVSKPTKETIEVYSSDGKKVYEADGLELTNFGAVSTTKYKAKVVATFENDRKAESPLISITVKTGTAKMKVTGTPTLYLKDRNSRGKFTLTSDDLTLNAIKDLKDGGVEIKDQKYKDMFELYDYGNGQYAIGFNDSEISDAAAKLKSVSIPVNIRHEGNNTAKPDSTVTLKVTIVK